MVKISKIIKSISIIFIVVSFLFAMTNFIVKNKSDKNSLYNMSSSSAIEHKEINSTNISKNINFTSDNIGVPVIYYHSVNKNAENELMITPDALEEQLNYINDNNYTTITITELYEHLKNKKPIPEKSILITFDDGYMNNYTEAFPILKKLNMKATIFCVGNSLDGSYYLSEEAIKEMSSYGIDIQSHTVNHLHLDTLNYNEQLSELKQSKQILERITGKEVISIAYPFGDYNQDTVKAAKEAGYKMAFTTNLGLSDRDDNIYELDRIYISSYYDMNTFKRLLTDTNK